MSCMTVRYKFVSEKDFREIRLPERYTTVRDLKLRIFNSSFKDQYENNKSQYHSIWKGCCLGTDHDLHIIDSKTNTPYKKDSALISDQAAVLIRRVAGDHQRRLIDTEPINLRETDSDGDSSVTVDENIITSRKEEEIDIHDFGEKKKGPVDGDEEDKKIPAASRKRKRHMPYSPFSSLSPPWDNYVCHRCKIEGHHIKECPTNGDPDYDLCKKAKTMAVNRAAEKEFDNLMEGISSDWRSSKSTLSSETTTTSSSRRKTSSYSGSGAVPGELNCPICRSVMRDAVLAKRCCFRSFCDGCIRDNVKKSKACACGATNGEDDFVVPNVAVRNLIKSILLQKSSSTSSCSSDITSVGSNSGSINCD